MKLDYFLKEGIIDIRKFDSDWSPTEGKKTRVQIRLNETPGVSIVQTNQGKALLSKCTREMLFLTHEIIDHYAIQEDLLRNIDLAPGLQVIKEAQSRTS